MSERGDEAIVALQTGRPPRSPWRVGSRCCHGYPQVIVSPTVLDDGTRFPTWAWLTCPHLVDGAARAESAGEIAAWNTRLSSDPVLMADFVLLEEALLRARREESMDGDACPEAGIAGQRVSGNVKCLHAHTALYLVGFVDPVGRSVVAEMGEACVDNRCALLQPCAEEEST